MKIHKGISMAICAALGLSLLSGCKPKPIWVEVEAVAKHTNDGTLHSTFDYTIVREVSTGKVYRLKEHSWCGIEGTFVINKRNRGYVYDNKD